MWRVKVVSNTWVSPWNVRNRLRVDTPSEWRHSAASASFPHISLSCHSSGFLCSCQKHHNMALHRKDSFLWGKGTTSSSTVKSCRFYFTSVSNVWNIRNNVENLLLLSNVKFHLNVSVRFIKCRGANGGGGANKGGQTETTTNVKENLNGLFWNPFNPRERKRSRTRRSRRHERELLFVNCHHRDVCCCPTAPERLPPLPNIHRCDLPDDVQVLWWI